MIQSYKLKILVHRGLLLSAVILSFSFRDINKRAVDFNMFGSSYLSDAKVEGKSDGFGDELDFSTLTKIGVNINAPISELIGFHGQVMGSGGRYGDTVDLNKSWDLSVEYSFINIPLHHNFQLNFGRLIFPIWLTSEYMDVGYELPFITTPDATTFVSPLKSLNGISGDITIFKDIFIRPFIGQERAEVSDASYELKDLLGASIRWEPSAHFKLQTSGYKSDYSTSTNENAGDLSELFIDNASYIEVFSLGAQLKINDFLFMTEYGKTKIRYNENSYYRNYGIYFLTGYNYEEWLFKYTFSYSETHNNTNRFDSHFVGFNRYLGEGCLLKSEIGVQNYDIGSNELTNYRYRLGVDFVF